MILKLFPAYEKHAADPVTYGPSAIVILSAIPHPISCRYMLTSKLELLSHFEKQIRLKRAMMCPMDNMVMN
jgi:hypothetical protein